MKALVTRLDSFGDVLLAGPAIRAVAARADHVTLLCGPRGAPAAPLLPGVDEVLVWDAPWAGFDPPPVGRGEVDQLPVMKRPPDEVSGPGRRSRNRRQEGSGVLQRHSQLPRFAHSVRDELMHQQPPGDGRGQRDPVRPGEDLLVEVALQRGPLVYCLEEADNGANLHNLALPANSEFRVFEGKGIFAHKMLIQAEGVTHDAAEAGSEALWQYDRPAVQRQPKTLTFIPWFSWANRGEGEMRIWVDEG